MSPDTKLIDVMNIAGMNKPIAKDSIGSADSSSGEKSVKAASKPDEAHKKRADELSEEAGKLEDKGGTGEAHNIRDLQKKRDDLKNKIDGAKELPGFTGIPKESIDKLTELNKQIAKQGKELVTKCLETAKKISEFRQGSTDAEYDRIASVPNDLLEQAKNLLKDPAVSTSLSAEDKNIITEQLKGISTASLKYIDNIFQDNGSDSHPNLQTVKNVAEIIGSYYLGKPAEAAKMLEDMAKKDNIPDHVKGYLNHLSGSYYKYANDTKKADELFNAAAQNYNNAIKGMSKENLSKSDKDKLYQIQCAEHGWILFNNNNDSLREIYNKVNDLNGCTLK